MPERPVFEDKNVLTTFVKECELQRDRDGSIETVIRHAHDEGFSILDCMTIVKQVYGVGLGEAKRLVTSHPSWRVETEKMDTFSQGLADALEREPQVP